MDESFFRISDSDRQRIFPGRKAGFFGTRQYNAPTYYGNTAAGCHRIDHLRFFMIISQENPIRRSRLRDELPLYTNIRLCYNIVTSEH